MSFTALVAADVNGAKHNLELSFPGQPTMVELYKQIESTYNLEAPGGNFRIERLQVFDIDASAWRDLTAANQLRDYAQLYAFQRDTSASEQQQPIPPPRKPAQSPMQAAPAPYQTMNPVQTLPVARSGEVMQMSVRPTPANRFPMDPTDEVKVQMVFEEIDENKNGVIEKDEWQRKFKQLRMPFSDATTLDLLARADADGDDVVNRPDFANFAEHYPVTVDSLYLRIQADAEEQRRDQIVENHKHLIDELQRRERTSTAQHRVAKEELKAAESQLRAKEQDMQIKQLEVEGYKAELLGVDEQITETQREVQRRERTITGARDRERAAAQVHKDAEQEVEGHRYRISAKMVDISNAQDVVRELEQQLQDAKRIADRHQVELGSFEDALEESRTSEREARTVLDQAQLALAPLMASLKEAESALAKSHDAERKLEALIVKAEKDVVRVERSVEASEIDIEPLVERENYTKQLHNQAQAELDESRAGLRQLEQDVEDFREHRTEAEEAELVLLEEEVRLREQRYNLEEREMSHHGEKYRHFNTTGRLNTTSSTNRL